MTMQVQIWNLLREYTVEIASKKLTAPQVLPIVANLY